MVRPRRSGGAGGAALAGGGLGDFAAACLPLVWCVGVHAQGVDFVFDLIGQQCIDSSMAFDQGVAFEGIADDKQLEVAFGAFGHIVHMAFVDDVQSHGGEAFDNDVVNFVCYFHWVLPEWRQGRAAFKPAALDVSCRRHRAQLTAKSPRPAG